MRKGIIKLLLSIFLVLAFILTSSVVYVNAANNESKYFYEADDPKCIPLSKAIKDYENDNGTKIDTYPLYFYIPNGDYNFRDSDGETLLSWFKEDFTNVCLTYYGTENIPCPDGYGVGYSINKADINNVYYADVPYAVERFSINNGLSSSGGFNHTIRPVWEACISNLLHPKEDILYKYPNASFEDEFIFVFLNSAKMNFSFELEYGGDYYYYYKNGCYGDIKDGENNLKENCLNPSHNHKNYKFKDKFVEQCANELNQVNFYDELYYHYDENNIDWTLIKGTFESCPWTLKYGLFNNVVIKNEYPLEDSWQLPYGVYDVKEDRFINIVEAYNSNKYDCLIDVLYENGIGTILGDIDRDNKITITDATGIQSCMAKLKEFPTDDEITDEYSCCYGQEVKYLSDYNIDGSRDILDATAIQKSIVNL